MDVWSFHQLSDYVNTEYNAHQNKSVWGLDRLKLKLKQNKIK